MAMTLDNALVELKELVSTSNNKICSLDANSREELLVEIGALAAYADMLIYELPATRAAKAKAAQIEVDSLVQNIENHIAAANERDEMSATLVSSARKAVRKRL